MIVKILILCTFVNTERNFFKYHRVFPMLFKKEPGWMEYLTSSGLGEPRLGTNLGGENRVGCLGRCFCWNADSGIVSWGSTLCHGNSSVLVLFHNEQYNKTKILNISNSLWKTRKTFNYHYFMSLTYYLIIRKIQNYKQNQIWFFLV